MIKSYFQLFDEPNKFLEVMDDLNLKVNEAKQNEDTEMDEQTDQITEIDKILSELLDEVKTLEESREEEVKKYTHPLLPL